MQNEPTTNKRSGEELEKNLGPNSGGGDNNARPKAYTEEQRVARRGYRKTTEHRQMDRNQQAVYNARIAKEKAMTSETGLPGHRTEAQIQVLVDNIRKRTPPGWDPVVDKDSLGILTDKLRYKALPLNFPLTSAYDMYDQRFASQPYPDPYPNNGLTPILLDHIPFTTTVQTSAKTWIHGTGQRVRTFRMSEKWEIDISGAQKATAFDVHCLVSFHKENEFIFLVRKKIVTTKDVNNCEKDLVEAISKLIRCTNRVFLEKVTNRENIEMLSDPKVEMIDGLIPHQRTSILFQNDNREVICNGQGFLTAYFPESMEAISLLCPQSTSCYDTKGLFDDSLSDEQIQSLVSTVSQNPLEITFDYLGCLFPLSW